MTIKGISSDTKYSNKHDWLRTIFEVLITTAVGIGGYFGGEQKAINDMNEHIQEIENNQEKLNNKISDLEADKQKLSDKNKELKKELSESLATSFPEGYYYPATGVYLLDNFEMKNEVHCRSFADSAASMKGQIYNNGLILSYEGQVVFYLNKKYKILEFIVGPIDNNTTRNMSTIKVYVDRQQMNQVINQKYETECIKYTFDISDCNELKIQWSNCGSSSYGIGDLKIYE